jgi:hypothetical protein
MNKPVSIMNAELQKIKTARCSLQKFRSKLVRPSVGALESGSADLMVAVECLSQLEPILASRGRRSASLQQSLGLEVASLRRELQQVNALMDGAGKFYEGWARLLSSASDDATANYTANGKPGTPVFNDSNNEVIHG